MRGRIFPPVLVVLAISWPVSGAVPSGPDPREKERDSYEQGLELLASGDIGGALSLWAEAREKLAGAGIEDPRIARAFVEAVAKYGLDDYAEVATDVFYWGFSGGPGPPGAATGDEIRAEGRRTFALADSLVAEHWAAVGRDDPASLAMAIKRFWIERDPTPSTPVNERLVEHWQRIAHARKMFVYNHSSPYRTDDRGTFFVKYGLPDEITRGHAAVDAKEEAMYDISGYLRMAMDVSPQFEIWRYGTIHPGEATYFLFGNTGGTGPFEHVEGLHQMLPGNSWTRAGRRRIRPGDVLQLVYYADLARAGGPFLRRYEELDRIWLASGRGPSAGALDAATTRFLTDDALDAMRPRPPAHSALDDLPRSVLSAQAVRILSDAEPRLLALAVTSPLWAVNADSAAIGDRDFDLAPYAARSTAVVRNGRLDEMLRADMIGTGDERDLFELVVRHVKPMRHLTVVAEHTVAGDQADSARRVLPGQQHFDLGEPLSRATREVEVSDLLVGLPPDAKSAAGTWDWPLLPGTRFWRADVLRVYFEAYHPAGAPADRPRNLELRITVVPGGRLGTLDPPTPATIAAGELASIGITLQSRAPDDAHFFDLDLRNEPAGLLWVVIETTDPETGTTHFRTTPVTLLEN